MVDYCRGVPVQEISLHSLAADLLTSSPIPLPVASTSMVAEEQVERKASPRQGKFSG